MTTPPLPASPESQPFLVPLVPEVPLVPLVPSPLATARALSFFLLDYARMENPLLLRETLSLACLLHMSFADRPRLLLASGICHTVIGTEALPKQARETAARILGHVETLLQQPTTGN